MNGQKSIVVFCGSQPGRFQAFTEMAAELGKFLAEQKIRVIYGGGCSGLMGALAGSALAHKGEVVAVVPPELNREHEDFTPTEIIRARDIQHRNKTMYALSDGAIPLPGAFGSSSEIFEYIVWTQLGLHEPPFPRKPLCFLNVRGYQNQLINYIDNMLSAKMLAREHREIVQVESSPSDAVASIYRQVEEWQGLKVAAG